jgi:hypothetical protein
MHRGARFRNTGTAPFSILTRKESKERRLVGAGKNGSDGFKLWDNSGLVLVVLRGPGAVLKERRPGLLNADLYHIPPKHSP